jgi:transcriptional regulator GlxA family with amidase domain
VQQKVAWYLENEIAPKEYARQQAELLARDSQLLAAGVTSGFDLALALIEQDAGRKDAIEIARILVVYLKRAGGQSQYSALLAAQAHSDSDAFSELELWIAENLRSDLTKG